ncbi:MAG: relaxase/mobilization nuclease domain-containing protein [Lachnospiraceae bacterium]|jgi:hypothetical protein
MMAATKLIALHINKGKTLAKTLEDRIDYAHNPEKTENGNYISSYECDPKTVLEEFLLTKRAYQQATGRRQNNDVIAYMIRQSFKPGEVTPEEANRLGYELGMRFTKGKHAFIVDTHTDKPHIHNHIIFNSTMLDASKKFNNFWFSGLAIQRLSDLICLENGLSVIERKSKSERQQQPKYEKKDTFRDGIRIAIDEALDKKPKDFNQFLVLMEDVGFEVKRGKHIAFRSKGQQRFIRLRSLGEGYSEDEIRDVIDGVKAKTKEVPKKQKLNLLIDIERKIIGKGKGYERWATNFNLKSMSKTLLFLRDNKIESMEDLKMKSDEATEKFNTLSAGIKEKENRMAELLALKKHIFNYNDTREVYIQYRKSGYSKDFFEKHREQITLHKAAKKAFDECGLQKLPTAKDLNKEYYELMNEKKQMYLQYHNLKNEMQELMKAKKNVERFLSDKEKTEERERTSR